MNRIFAPLLLAVWPSLLDAAPQADQPKGRTIVGSVVFQGKPVTGATVTALWDVMSSVSESTFSKAILTDADGRFAISWSDDPRARPSTLFARDSLGRLGWSELRFEADLGISSGQRIELHEVAVAHGRLTDSTGSPLRQARVRVIYLMLGLDENAREYGVRAWADSLTTTTDDDGRFRLKGVPAGGRVHAEVTAPGYGNPRINWPQNLPCEVRLETSGSIRVRFDGANDASILAGLKMIGYGKSGAESAPIRIHGEREFVADGKETQTFADITPGRFTLYTHNEWKTHYVTENPPEFVVPPGGVGEVTIKLNPAVEVRGRVTDAKTHKGIPAVQVNISTQTERAQHQAWTKTDAEGRFHAWVTPGNLSVSVISSSGNFVAGYQPPPEQQEPRKASVAAGEAYTFPGY